MFNPASLPHDFHPGIAPPSTLRERLSLAVPVLRHGNKPAVVSARLTAEQARKLDACAKAAKLTRGTYVGKLVSDHLARLPDSPAKE